MHDNWNASTWLVDRNVAAGRGAHVALRCGGESFTYDDVLARVEEVAAALRGLGVRSEERVAMAVLDSVEFVAAFLGAMRIGAVPLPMNPLLPGRDLAVITADARARIAVVSAERVSQLDELVAGAPELATVVVTGTTDVPVIPPVDSTSGVRRLACPAFVAAGAGLSGAAAATWAESPGFWLCTSGSTGQPKLAMHRHGDIATVAHAYGQGVLSVSADDRCYSVGPMFHAYGIGNSLFFPFSVGATAILDPVRPPTPARVAATVAAEQPTLFFCIPTFYAALLAADLPHDSFASVRWAASAAEPLPADTFTRFGERFGVTVLDGIGSTEMLHIYLSNSPDFVRGGTSGRAVPGYAVRVVDDAGADQPDGTPGQLLVRGESMATGYWCRGETSRATFVGEWMHTGDLYVRDASGFHTYMGRVDDMLRVGGEWVSPAEVEAALIEHATVLEAAVVGERDAAGVLRPVAFVVAAAGADVQAAVLEAHCRDRLAGYKRPKRYVVVADLPKTATGKVQRFRLRGTDA